MSSSRSQATADYGSLDPRLVNKIVFIAYHYRRAEDVRFNKLKTVHILTNDEKQKVSTKRL